MSFTINKKRSNARHRLRKNSSVRDVCIHGVCRLGRALWFTDSLSGAFILPCCRSPVWWIAGSFDASWCILVNRRARSLSYRQSRSLARLLTNNGFEARFSNCTRSDTRVEGRTWCHPSAGMINPVLIPEPLIYCREQCCSTHFTAHLTTKYTCILQLNWTECKLYWPTDGRVGVWIVWRKFIWERGSFGGHVACRLQHNRL